MISLAMLAFEILILGIYFSALRKRTSRQKLQPYLIVLYLLICCSTAVGLVSFYRGETSNFKTATQVLVMICLIPNLAIIFVLIHSPRLYDARTQDWMT
jgi:membrane protein YdbS with pleckstrin-like domain